MCTFKKRNGKDKKEREKAGVNQKSGRESKIIKTQRDARKEEEDEDGMKMK